MFVHNGHWDDISRKCISHWIAYEIKYVYLVFRFDCLLKLLNVKIQCVEHLSVSIAWNTCKLGISTHSSPSRVELS